MCKSRQALSNAYLLAKFGFDTAENEACKDCPLSAYRSPRYHPDEIRRAQGCAAELKGSIGEGPNHSNHSNHSNSFKIGIFPRKFKNFRKFQHFLNYRRNSDKISSKSEQKSPKEFKNNECLQNFAKKCEKIDENFLKY